MLVLQRFKRSISSKKEEFLRTYQYFLQEISIQQRKPVLVFHVKS